MSVAGTLTAVFVLCVVINLCFIKDSSAQSLWLHFLSAVLLSKKTLGLLFPGHTASDLATISEESPKLGKDLGGMGCEWESFLFWVSSNTVLILNSPPSPKSSGSLKPKPVRSTLSYPSVETMKMEPAHCFSAWEKKKKKRKKWWKKKVDIS